MAILIMGVGVVSVFTLFPISVLRTIQATNQTNAKILKENVEEQLSQSPGLLTSFEGAAFQGEWKPGVSYNVNEIVFPSVKPGSPVPRPLALFRVQTAGGPSGLVEPTWNVPTSTVPTPTTTDGGIIWEFVALQRYVVDPLGWNIARDDGQVAGVIASFGNSTDPTTGVASVLAGPLLRIHGGRNTTISAAESCTHPDTWQQAAQATPTIVDAVSATFPATVELGGIAGSALAAPRIVLTSSDGSQTVVRQLVTPIAAPTVTWTAPLPDRFQRPLGSGQFDVGLARIEVFNRRYSWFMTVRNVGARPEIKCVVTFNRSFASAEEHAYNANFGNPNLDLDGDGFLDGDTNQDGTVDPLDGDWSSSGQIVIAWTAAEPEPLIKAGNWLFDARDVSWYRIQSVDAAVTSARVTLDRSVRAQTPAAGPLSPGRAILMPGIVEIFDL